MFIVLSSKANQYARVHLGHLGEIRSAPVPRLSRKRRPNIHQ